MNFLNTSVFGGPKKIVELDFWDLPFCLTSHLAILLHLPTKTPTFQAISLNRNRNPGDRKET